ncbi:hypothetical protein JOD67_002208 [Tenggerimyces flavus]|nr:hypothetical protein [Tenggerimyces flavus]
MTWPRTAGWSRESLTAGRRGAPREAPPGIERPAMAHGSLPAEVGPGEDAGAFGTGSRLANHHQFRDHIVALLPQLFVGAGLDRFPCNFGHVNAERPPGQRPWMITVLTRCDRLPPVRARLRTVAGSGLDRCLVWWISCLNVRHVVSLASVPLRDHRCMTDLTLRSVPRPRSGPGRNYRTRSRIAKPTFEISPDPALLPIGNSMSRYFLEAICSIYRKRVAGICVGRSLGLLGARRSGWSRPRRGGALGFVDERSVRVAVRCLVNARLTGCRRPGLTA